MNCAVLLRHLKMLVLTGSMVCGATTALNAGLDLDAEISGHTNLQLIVMEAPGCIYCDLFRRDVLPAYQKSPRAKILPVRFIDVNNLDDAKLKVSSPVEIVPTFVVMRDDQEIGRIPGYVGPEIFYQSINHLISSIP